MSQTPSVRRFLANTDVVHAVFDHLDLFPHPIPSYLDSRPLHLGRDAIVTRRTLVNAALTCRAFSELASKTLWRCLHIGLLPLLKVFELYRDEQDFEGDISEAEWERFDRLASRVRYVDFLRYGAPEPSVVDALLRRCQTKGAALLPNLRILFWREALGRAHTLQLLRALCAGPSLALVSISPQIETRFSSSDSVAQDLAAIAEVRPDLDHFSSTGSLRLQFNNPLLSIRSLKSLNVGKVDDASFYQIGTFPYLTGLSTALSDEHDADSPSVHSARTLSQINPTFPALRWLTTHGAPANLVWMITQISSPNLTSLSVSIDGEHLADILPPLETAFALPAVQSLQRLDLDINFHGELWTEGDMEVSFTDLVQSILPLRHLEYVRLCPQDRTLSVSDTDIVLIKSAWPRLRRLSLSFDAHERVHPLRPSLLALVDLALARPQLESLEVEVASVTEDDLVQLERISNGVPGLEHPRMLERLTLARDRYREHIRFPTDIPRLVRALHRLFPFVGSPLGRPIKEGKDGQITSYFRWSEFDMKYDVFQVVYQLEKLKSQPCRHT
ncbi:hypothetical protein C8Q74DRAFT_191737 [Fomes fomentarius]|nr:hypothetical protein C8Q74DRAFT_191737 [Fomes fomentarius]